MLHLRWKRREISGMLVMTRLRNDTYLSICSFQAWNQCGSRVAFVFAGSYREGDDIEKGGSDGTTAPARHNGKSEIGSKATVRVGARERKCIIVVMQRVCDSFGVAR